MNENAKAQGISRFQFFERKASFVVNHKIIYCWKAPQANFLNLVDQNDSFPFKNTFLEEFRLLNRSQIFKKIRPAAGFCGLPLLFMNLISDCFFSFAFFIRKLDIRRTSQIPGKGSLGNGRILINCGFA